MSEERICKPHSGGTADQDANLGPSEKMTGVVAFSDSNFEPMIPIQKCILRVVREIGDRRTLPCEKLADSMVGSLEIIGLRATRIGR
jgi:hypothetical protein